MAHLLADARSVDRAKRRRREARLGAGAPRVGLSKTGLVSRGDVTQLAAFDRHLPQDLATDSRGTARESGRQVGSVRLLRAPDSLMSGEGRGESHATNDRTGVRAGPQQSRDSVALAARTARPTKKDGPMARRPGFFDDLMSIGLKLPWNVGVAAAVVIFVALHVVAIYTQTPIGANTVADMGAVVQRGRRSGTSSNGNRVLCLSLLARSRSRRSRR